MDKDVTPEERADIELSIKKQGYHVDLKEVQIIKVSDLPDPLSIGSKTMTYLSKAGKCVAWLVWSGITIVGIFLIPPSFQDGLNWYVAKSKPILESVENLFDNLKSDPETPQPNVEHSPGYIVINDGWKNLSDEEFLIITNKDTFNVNVDHTAITASTNADYGIISGSGLYPSDPDFPESGIS